MHLPTSTWEGEELHLLLSSRSVKCVAWYCFHFGLRAMMYHRLRKIFPICCSGVHKCLSHPNYFTLNIVVLIVQLCDFVKKNFGRIGLSCTLHFIWRLWLSWVPFCYSLQTQACGRARWWRVWIDSGRMWRQLDGISRRMNEHAKRRERDGTQEGLMRVDKCCGCGITGEFSISQEITNTETSRITT